MGLESSGVMDVQAVTSASITGEGISASLELVWRDMQEAWFNAILGSWGPGSPVWDDIGPTNNLLLQSHLSIPTSRQQEFQAIDFQNQPESPTPSPS
uniref:Uncharacterized protein n=1 Tax=Nelumbo nucifera TaxID=4432 RepID=A0A822YDG7_NELNU|nr:TPA_asm: hypothetical protein HUJ06_011045 [Nelumbo nucifera]